MTSEQPWWRNTVFYQIYPRSFADGNGDGIGDLIGVREHLDYLVELGVEALWLSPFFRSPMADGGYDVADPCDVDPMFGTLADFDALARVVSGGAGGGARQSRARAVHLPRGPRRVTPEQLAFGLRRPGLEPSA